MATIQPYTHIPGHRLAEWVRRADLAVLPLASVEWHGPHMPLGTDLILADGFAGSLEGDFTAVLFPAVVYNACPGKTQGYRGTVPVRSEVALMYLSDVLAGILSAGFVRVLLLNGHDANMAIARAAMEAVSADFRSSLLLVNWWQMVEPGELQRAFGLDNGGRGHGGPYEAAVTWALAPQAVEPEAAEELSPRADLPFELPWVRVESRPDPWNGYSGYVSRASRETGEALAARARANLARLIQTWLAADLPGEPHRGRHRRGDPAGGAA